MTCAADLPVEEVSCGVPYLIVPLRDAGAVERAVADGGALRRLADAIGASLPVYLFADAGVEPVGRGLSQARGASAKAAAPPEYLCRMFAPGLGVTRGSRHREVPPVRWAAIWFGTGR